MKLNFQNKIFVYFLLIAFQISFGQKKEETIGSEVVNVVKPYTPTISDAYKIKETPSLDDEGNTAKETVKYTIFSFPVASTFTPSKGKSEGVEKSKREHLFSNYATLGIGNYGTLNAELFVTQDLGNYDYVAGMFRHHSSQGRINNVILKDKFYDTALDIAYGQNTREMSWNIDLGYQNQVYNWYGLPANFGLSLFPENRTMLIMGIDPTHAYNTIKFGGKIKLEDGIFSDASFNITHFTDSYSSSENRVVFKPSFKININDSFINTDLMVDYVGGSFKNNYFKTNIGSIKYSFANFGIMPGFIMTEEDWTIQLRAGLFYSMDTENNKNKIFLYPQINASYKLVGDLMIFYLGAEGSLKQNSYADLVSENPFLSPTLNIIPTSSQYDIYAGLKGKLANNISYNIRASYLNEESKALYKSNDYDENSFNENYAFGNSLQVVYDNVKTLSFFGELKADFSENISFGINGKLNNYTNTYESEAWNLPTMRLASTLDVIITKQWYAGMNLFYVGERKDKKAITFSSAFSDTVTLKSYFDVNAHVGYKYNERLTAFLKFNNIGNQSYEKWLDYPVQGFQVVVGANYKFDF